MEIAFATTRLQKQCSSGRGLRRRLGDQVARKATAHLATLAAATSLEDLRYLPGRCHELRGDRDGQLAIDLPDGKRLVLEPAAEPAPSKPDGGLDWTQVRDVRILEIEDYH